MANERALDKRCTEEVAKGRIETCRVVPWNHVSSARHAYMLHRRRCALQFGDVLVAHHIAALGGDQQRRHVQLCCVCLEIVGMEALVRFEYCALVTGVQPLSA